LRWCHCRKGRNVARYGHGSLAHALKVRERRREHVKEETKEVREGSEGRSEGRKEGWKGRKER
jgi:hypothetical protein